MKCNDICIVIGVMKIYVVIDMLQYFKSITDADVVLAEVERFNEFHW